MPVGYVDNAALATTAVSTSEARDPLVSVIVPCYNGAAFLEEALRSALAQSYPEVEVVVVDDGSTDSSAEIARRFPVRYIRQENRGLSEARNLGIRESKGSYLVFLDADDRLKPRAIETGLGALALRPDCALTVGDHVFIAADSSYLADSAKERHLHSHYEALLRSNFIEMISSVLFRRSIFDEVGGFDATLRVAEDYELYLRIAREWPICCHPVIVAEYRMHGTNTSRDSELMLTTTLQVLKSQARYLDNDPGRLIAFHRGRSILAKAVWASACVRTGTFLFHFAHESSSPQAHAAVQLLPARIIDDHAVACSSRIQPAQIYGRLPPTSAGRGAKSRRRCTAVSAFVEPLGRR